MFKSSNSECFDELFEERRRLESNSDLSDQQLDTMDTHFSDFVGSPKCSKLSEFRFAESFGEKEVNNEVHYQITESLGDLNIEVINEIKHALSQLNLTLTEHLEVCSQGPN